MGKRDKLIIYKEREELIKNIMAQFFQGIEINK